jgi:hypothetical protein
VAPMTTGITKHFMFHIHCISMHNFFYIYNYYVLLLLLLLLLLSLLLLSGNCTELSIFISDYVSTFRHLPDYT